MTSTALPREELERLLGTLAADRALWRDFLTLCSFGGRLAGSPGEQAARDWATAALAAVPGGALLRDPVRYAGWPCHAARLTELATGRELAVAPLLAAAATPPCHSVPVLGDGNGLAERHALHVQAREHAALGRDIDRSVKNLGQTACPSWADSPG